MTRYRRIVDCLVLLALWPPTVFAATLSFGDAMRAITGASVVGWLLLSTLSGVTALFYRLDRELRRTGQRLPNAGVFVIAHMSGSLTMGAIAYLGGEGMGAPGLATAVSIIVFSFAGAAALEKFVESKMRSVLGSSATKPGELT